MAAADPGTAVTCAAAPGVCGAPPSWAPCGVMSRSQLAQDLWVLNLFRNLEGGFFLEIGANHPQAMSNTYVLEMFALWHGVSIDPFPRGDWEERRNATLLQAAVGPEGSRQPFVLPGHMWGALLRSANREFLERTVADAERRFVVVR